MLSLGMLVSQLETEKASNTEAAVRKTLFNIHVLTTIIVQIIARLNIT